ncbi:MAG: hypothetical protein LBL63_07040, partial [Clostridiales Family XIII bacterium]|nr:hypothetical protein [Clostridiales Family XIII bacterium]
MYKESKREKHKTFGKRAWASVLTLVLILTAAVPALVLADSANGGGSEQNIISAEGSESPENQGSDGSSSDAAVEPVEDPVTSDAGEDQQTQVNDDTGESGARAQEGASADPNAPAGDGSDASAPVPNMPADAGQSGKTEPQSTGSKDKAKASEDKGFLGSVMGALGSLIDIMSDEEPMDVEIGGVEFPASGTPDLTLDLLTPQTVTIDLSDLSGTTGKQLKITVPEGLAIDSYPGLAGADLPDIMQGFVTMGKEPAKDTSYTTTANFQVRNGELIYNLTDGYEGGQFTFTIGADRARFYGPHDVPNLLKIELIGGGNTLSEREIEAKIETTLSYAPGVTGTWRTDEYAIRTASTPGSVVEKTSYAPLGSEAPIMQHVTDMMQAGSVIRVVGKKQALTLTYPAQATLSGVYLPSDANKQPNGAVPSADSANLYNGPGTDGNTSVTHDAASRKVTFYYENRGIGASGNINDGPALRLIFNSGEDNKYGVISTLKFTAYDGGEVTHTDTAHFYQVVNPAYDTGRLSALSTTSSLRNTYITEIPGLTGLALVGFESKNTTAITDQAVKYTFPEALRIRGFEAPSQQTGTNPYEIEYKLYDETNSHTVTANLAYSATGTSGGKVRVTPTALGIPEGAILEWASIKVGDFGIGYKGYNNIIDINRGEGFFGNPQTPGTFNIGVEVTSSASVGAYNYTLPVVVNSTPRLYATISTEMTQKSGGYSYPAGEEIAVKSTFNANNDMLAAAIQKTEDPKFYILLPEGVDLTAGSVKVTGSVSGS